MTARRTATALTAATTLAPVALLALGSGSAAAHGSMEDPVSRVHACFLEGPEAPRSAACKALVDAGGTQPLYDWTEVNIPDAGGRSKEIVPDGKLCSAGRDKYRGLDLARADWPATELAAGQHTFRFKATAPHKGTFDLYVTKEGYDPEQPLAWSDLASEPFASATDPALENGSYVIDATVPERSGRHLIYAVWQRSDSPEAFYSCSDVVFGGSGTAAEDGAEPAKAPADAADAADAAEAPADDAPAQPQDAARGDDAGHGAHGDHGDHAAAAGDAGTPAAPAPQGGGDELAETGGDSGTAPVALGGAAALAIGAAALLNAVRRRTHGRHRA
jgi:chitin-binding protein